MTRISSPPQCKEFLSLKWTDSLAWRRWWWIRALLTDVGKAWIKDSGFREHLKTSPVQISAVHAATISVDGGSRPVLNVQFLFKVFEVGTENGHFILSDEIDSCWLRAPDFDGLLYSIARDHGSFPLQCKLFQRLGIYENPFRSVPAMLLNRMVSPAFFWHFIFISWNWKLRLLCWMPYVCTFV